MIAKLGNFETIFFAKRRKIEQNPFLWNSIEFYRIYLSHLNSTPEAGMDYWSLEEEEAVVEGVAEAEVALVAEAVAEAARAEVAAVGVSVEPQL